VNRHRLDLVLLSLFNPVVPEGTRWPAEEGGPSPTPLSTVSSS
jgi:hypothetical protein